MQSLKSWYDKLQQFREYLFLWNVSQCLCTKITGIISQQFSWCFYSMLYKFDFLYFANSVMPWFIAFLRRQYWRRRQVTELWLKMAGFIPASTVSPRLNFVQINFVMRQKLPVDTLEPYGRRSYSYTLVKLKNKYQGRWLAHSVRGQMVNLKMKRVESVKWHRKNMVTTTLVGNFRLLLLNGIFTDVKYEVNTYKFPCENVPLYPFWQLHDSILDISRLSRSRQKHFLLHFHLRNFHILSS